ncbi:sensor domain-containing diguanylate cyclase [Radicibacter daui]|uniref:sensor domain-containing diguanylate cyclase n=1 Tax=Radicibacter daui TaxID=3064829 RepID=UPI00404690B2
MGVIISAALLDRVFETLSVSRSLEELTRPLLGLLQAVTGLDSAYLTQVDEGAGVQSILFSNNSRAMVIPEGLSVPWGDTLCKRALDENCAYTDDVAARWGESEAARALGIQTYASTPIYLESGALYGTLCAASSERRPLSPDGQQVLSLFSTLIAQQVQREQLLEQLQSANRALEAASVTDMLTGLPNRRFIFDELRRLFLLAGRAGQKVLVAFVDLDGFKAINDNWGHEVGDAFLVEVGRRLAAGLRASDTLGRLGGDEFVIIGLTAPGERPGQAAEAAHRRLTPLLVGHYALRGVAFDYQGASFGVIEADPAETTPEDALRDADTLMYQDKKKNREARRAAG